MTADEIDDRQGRLLFASCVFVGARPGETLGRPTVGSFRGIRWTTDDGSWARLGNGFQSSASRWRSDPLKPPAHAMRGATPVPGRSVCQKGFLGGSWMDSRPHRSLAGPPSARACQPTRPYPLWGKTTQMCPILIAQRRQRTLGPLPSGRQARLQLISFTSQSLDLVFILSLILRGPRPGPSWLYFFIPWGLAKPFASV